jgi:ubiquinone/menaquinone biosynthesis C-methylase UbiE
LHGFSATEQERLRRRSRTLDARTTKDLPFQRSRQMLEVGCGVGAQTEMLLRRCPELHVTGVDQSKPNLAAAKDRHESLAWAANRWAFAELNVESLDFADGCFDSAYLCLDPGACAGPCPGHG